MWIISLYKYKTDFEWKTSTLSQPTPRKLLNIIGRRNGVHDYIKERTIKIGNYVLETRKTVRKIAKEFGVSKSTVHKDLTERLPNIDPELAKEVKNVLEYHKSIRHIRGGEATRKKYRTERDVDSEPEPII